MSNRQKEKSKAMHCCCCKAGNENESLKTFFYAVGYYTIRFLPGVKLATYRTKEKVSFLGKDWISYCPNCLSNLKHFYNIELLKRLGKFYVLANLAALLVVLGNLNPKIEWVGMIGSFLVLIFLVMTISTIIHLIRQKHAIVYSVIENQEEYKQNLAEISEEKYLKKIDRAFKEGSKIYQIESKDHFENFEIAFTRVSNWKNFPKYIKWDKFTPKKKLSPIEKQI